MNPQVNSPFYSQLGMIKTINTLNHTTKYRQTYFQLTSSSSRTSFFSISDKARISSSLVV